MVGDPGDHLLGLNRLGDVIGRAELEAGDLVGNFAQRRQEHDDRVARVGIALQRTAYFEAVELGHHHIEQDEIGMHPARNVERRAAVLRREQAITAALERAHDQPQIHRAVVDDKDCRTRRVQGRTARRKGHHTSHRSKGSQPGSWLLLERRGQPEQRIVIESGRQDRNAPPEGSGNVSALVRQLVSDRVEIGNAADCGRLTKA